MKFQPIIVQKNPMKLVLKNKHQHQHKLTPIDKIKPNSKSQKTGKKMNKIKVSASHSWKESDKVSLKY